MKEIVKFIREQARMSQEQFAASIGGSFVTINRWENGKTVPNQMAQKNLYLFCQQRGIDIYDFIINQIKSDNEGKKDILYHGSKTGIEGDITPSSRNRCDFGKGFYMGTDPSQPLTLICDSEKPTFYEVEFDETGLKVLDVELGLEWAMLIAYYRGYMDEVKESAIYKDYADKAKGYDVIIGYIADDRMFQVLTGFFEKRITDTAMVSSLSALDLGRQHVALTEKACQRIKIIRARALSPLEIAAIKEKSIARREEGVSMTDRIMMEHRRDGKFFDEILRGE